MGARGRHERCRRSRPQFRLQKWLETQQVGKCESLARSRHIDRRYLKIQEWVAEGLIRVVYKRTDQNRADMFTKPLDREPFERHASAIMGFSV